MSCKNNFKQFFKKFISRKYKKNIVWHSDSRPHVGIEYNKYFTRAKWRQSFDVLFSDVEQYYQIKYFSNKYEKYALISDLHVMCTSWIDKDLLEIAPQLKWVYVMQAGTEFLGNVRKNSGVTIKDARGFCSDSVGEYCLCMSLVLLKKLHQVFDNQKKKRWEQSQFIERNFMLLSQKKIGVLGLGKNGQGVAKVFSSLGCHVMGYDQKKIRSAYIREMYAIGQLHAIIKRSDILVICLPLTSATENLIAREELKLLGNTGILINTGRGEIVNETDLINALRHRVISGAALDVFTREPLPRSSRLWACPHCIITPHIAGNVNNHVDAIQRAFIRALKKYFKRK
jgi:phosphoglycerate dehydrogenase-like enzyme